MSADEVERLAHETRRYNRARINALENYTCQLRNAMHDEIFTSKLTAEDKSNIEDAIKNTTSWVDNNQTAEKEEFEAKHKEMEAIDSWILNEMPGD